MATPNPYFLYPFCSLGASGDITPINNTGSDSGTVNYQYGFTPNYELPQTDPSVLDVPRQQFNQLMFDVTNALQQLQTQGYPLWIAPASGSPPVGGPVNYPIYSVVAYNAGSGILIYESQVSSNTSVPGADDNWIVISGNALGIKSGMMISYAGSTAPSGYFLCDGSFQNRTTYANLFNAITDVQTCTTTNTMFDLTVIDSSIMYGDQANGQLGMPVEGAGIPADTRIVSITDSTTVVLSQGATASASVPVTFFRWGAGDGSTTFTLPNVSRRVIMGSGGVGSNVIGNVAGNIGGEEAHLQASNELASHTHTLNSNVGTSSGTQGSASGPLAKFISSTVGMSIVPASQVAMTILQPSMISTMIIKI